MYIYLLLLVLGFSSNIASTYTASFSARWGKPAGTIITILLRDIFGIPVWVAGFVAAIGNGRETLFPTSVFLMIIAWIVIVAGAAIIVASLLSIRIKAAAPSVDDKLVDNGLYAYVRHPVLSGTFIEFIGMFILWPSLSVLSAVVAGVVWIILQAKAEEHDLLKRIPGYKQYMYRVPGFFPSLILWK